MLRFTVALVTFGSLVGCSPSTDDQFLSACDQLIQSKLVAPAGYKRVSASSTDGPNTLASAAFTQFALSLGKKFSTAEYDQLGEASAAPAVFRKTIEYDAPNAFNTPLRSSAQCFFFAVDGRLTQVDAGNVVIKIKDDRS